MDNLKIVVAGHIDHGKSTLIGRLLYETDSLPQNVLKGVRQQSKTLGREEEFAFVTDRLAEEQAEGITIDTTQVEFKTTQRNYTLIDTPGHREFLKNMVTGATKADAAILVIDALQGLSEQTYRYAYLISMLGIREIIIVVNKMDLKLYNRLRFWELSEEIVYFLNKLNMQIIAIIPVSAKHGDNITAKSDRMHWNTSSTLMKALNYFSAKKNLTQLPLRFLVQCPYIRGSKATVLGRIASGKLFKNHKLVFGPVHHITKVLSIEVSGRERTAADCGESVALVLEDATNVERGQVGFYSCHPPLTTDYLIADIFWVGARPLKPADKIDILCGTRRCSAQIEKITEIIDPTSLKAVCTDADQLTESQIGNVEIKLASAICVDQFDKIPELGRLAIVQDDRITGGGILK